MAIVTPFVRVGTYPTRNFATLGTVIVTAAVYRGFNQEFAPHHLTFRHRAGVTPYTSTRRLSRVLCFVKQSQPLILCNPSAFVRRAYNLPGHTFFRSYGVNLPSSFS